jgi:hypothetical protein
MQVFRRIAVVAWFRTCDLLGVLFCEEVLFFQEMEV